MHRRKIAQAAPWVRNSPLQIWHKSLLGLKDEHRIWRSEVTVGKWKQSFCACKHSQCVNRKVKKSAEERKRGKRFTTNLQICLTLLLTNWSASQEQDTPVSRISSYFVTDWEVYIEQLALLLACCQCTMTSSSCVLFAIVLQHNTPLFTIHCWHHRLCEPVIVSIFTTRPVRVWEGKE